MYEEFVEHARRRPVVFTPSGWAGFQAWAGTWTGDSGGGLGILGGMLNTALVGHSWITNDMHVGKKDAILSEALTDPTEHCHIGITANAGCPLR